MIDIDKYNASQLFRLNFTEIFPVIVLIIFAIFALTLAKKKISLITIPVAIGCIFYAFPDLQIDNLQQGIIQIVLMCITLCLFVLTLFGVIKQKAPAIVLIVIVMVWTAIQLIRGRAYLKSFYLEIPCLLFFISMIIFIAKIKIKKNSKYAIESELYNVQSIALSIFLSIITFGIYGLVWEYSMCKKIRILNHENTGCTSEWLCLVFVPFYSLYWVYTRSNKITVGAAERGISVPDNGIICLIVSFFSLAIIAFALIQNNLNEIVVRLSDPANTSLPNTSQFQDTVYTSTAPYVANYIEEIKQLSELNRQGVLTDVEFDCKKKELLGKI